MKDIVFIRIGGFGGDSENMCFLPFQTEANRAEALEGRRLFKQINPALTSCSTPPTPLWKTSHNTWRKGRRGNCIWYIINRPYRTGATPTADTQHQTRPLSVIHDPNPFTCQWYNRLAFGKTAACTISSPIQPSYRPCLYFHSLDMLTENRCASFVSAASLCCCASRESLWMCGEDSGLPVLFPLECFLLSNVSMEREYFKRRYLISEGSSWFTNTRSAFAFFKRCFHCAAKHNFKVEGWSVKRFSGPPSLSEGANTNTPRPSAGLSLNLGKSSGEDNRN